MKKGFTLIELLAVILILGIIALIAIPTVNNILKEAREGAFKISSNNVIKSIEEQCQSSLIKGNDAILTYTFNNGKSSSKIDVKGELPKEGYVFLDNSCNVMNYYLTSNNYVYTNNNEEINEDYMIKKSEKEKSLFINLYSNYNLINIYFVDNMNIPNNAIEIKDISVSQNNKINSWLVPNNSDYDLYVGSEGTIFANTDSSYLFSNFSSVKNIYLENFNTSYINKMNHMFYNSKALESVDVSNFDTSNVVDMQYMFYKCEKLLSLNVINWDIARVTNMSNMFNVCKSLTILDLSSWKSTTPINASKMFGTYNSGLKESCLNLVEIKFPTAKNSLYFNECSEMFACCFMLSKLDLSGINTSLSSSMYAMFYHCRAFDNIDITSLDVSSSTSLEAMFQGCTNLKTIDVSNFKTSNVFYSHGMFAQCSSLTHVYGLDKWDTSNLTRVSSMFNSSPLLEYIDISTWNTKNLNKVSLMFYGCSSLKEIDLSKWDTRNLEYVDKTFYNCENLTKVFLSNWNFSKVINFENIFTNCNNLNFISIANANTANTIDDYLPTRSSDRIGTLEIKGDKVGLDSTIINSKYWNIV